MEKEPSHKESFLPRGFFKQFKSKEEFRSFFDDLFKRGVEERLQAGLDEHLGYEKYAKEGQNSGNGSYPKKVKTESVGDMVLNLPWDRRIGGCLLLALRADGSESPWRGGYSHCLYR